MLEGVMDSKGSWMSRRISRATAVTARIAAAAVVLGCASVVLPASASAAPASAAAVAASPARLFTPAAGSCTPAAADYVTRPDLRPVGACTTGNIALTAPGYLFTAPNGQGRGGPTIYADDGSVVWTKPRSVGDEQNFQVLNVGGRKLLAYYHGAWLVFGVETRGEFVLLDEHYREVGHIRSNAGYQPSLHELRITPAGTALIGSYAPVLTMAAGRPVVAYDYVVQEVDFQHDGKVLFEWHALDHVPLTASWAPVPGALGAFDYFHGNSIDLLPGGDLLVSARNTWSVYRISRADGHVVWTLGHPRDGSGSFGAELLGSDDGWFCYQHDARSDDGSTVTLFDNGGGGPGCAHPARELTVRLDQAAGTATAGSMLRHQPDLYTNYTGNSQLLSNGDRLVSWADTGQVTEFDAAGQPVMEMTLGQFSYRVQRSPWQGFPLDPPVAVRDGANLRVSWNGATEVARWQLLGGPDRNSLHKIADAVPRQGFETSIPVPSGTPVVAVQALGADGSPLAHGQAFAGRPTPAPPGVVLALQAVLRPVLTFGGFGLPLLMALELGLVLGVVLALVRLLRGQGLRRAGTSLAGMTLLILLVDLTGCVAQPFYPPMLYLNLIYPVLFLIGNLVGWPLVGVLIGLIAGRGAQWRHDPAALRAYRRAGWLWVAYFGLKLVVQMALYLAGNWVGLWIAKVTMGWPLWIVTVVATVLVVWRTRRGAISDTEPEPVPETEETPRPVLA